MSNRSHRLILALLSALAVSAALPVGAQVWPAKPVTLVVPFPPGGGNDLVARQIAPALQQVLGQPVVVDNKPGAGGTLGVAYVTKAAPDGYTLSICATGNVAVAPALYSKLSYGVKDLVPVSHIVNTPTVWVGAPDLPANTLKEFIELARSQPGKFNYGSSGNGTTPHLAGEALKARHGLDLQHVPYKGTTPAYTDIGSGRVSVMMDSLISALPLLEGGRVKGLAMGTSARLPKLPGVPTLAEQGLSDMAFTGWVGICAPVGTPQAVVERMGSAVAEVLARPAMRESLVKQVTEPVGAGPARFGELIQRDAALWKKIVTDSNAQLD
ncbi:MAG: tripartite tricarboxylate transporter substrate binding protein [Rhodoferax sp.]|nr:tripartite tricarboxylate transporter substrate binding protein [Rhodoferax sp.]